MRYVVAFLAVVLLAGAGLFMVTRRADEEARRRFDADMARAKGAVARLDAAEEAVRAEKNSPRAIATRTLQAPTLADAIRESRPLATDKRGDPGLETVALANWFLGHAGWSELQALPETTMGKATKDTETERGKRVCSTGVIANIKASDAAAMKTYEGMFMAGGVIAKFLAVGSTGDLVAQSQAKFCGVVTGRNVLTGPQLVGMFDLPENRKGTP